MAKKSNPTKGAADKARRITKQTRAITKSPKACTVIVTTPEASEGGDAETDRAILEAARNEIHSDLAELGKALDAVVRCSNSLKQSLAVARRNSHTVPGGISFLGPDGLKYEMPISNRVLRGEWGARWKCEYREWVLSIRAAMDAVGRSSVAAIMDRNSHPHPALCWTALVRDALNRLQAQLHPMKEGADGMGFPPRWGKLVTSGIRIPA
jgi:hypothetical protein